MSLLPSRGPDASAVQEGEVEVMGVDDDVEDLLDALSSDTARAVLNAIYEDPGTPSEIAQRLDMSIQKVSYHLDKLEDRDLIAVAGTRYSEKGQEMTVYEPPDDPLVLFVGTEERKRSFTDLVKRLLPAVAVLGLASVAVQRFLGRNLGLGASSGADQGGQIGAESVDTNAGSGGSNLSGNVTPTSSGGDVTVMNGDGADLAREAASQALEPGLAFFLGGALVLALVVGWWTWSSRR